MKKESSNEVDLAVIQTDISYIKESMTKIVETLDKNYVTRTEFDPIKRIVYGMVGLILVTVFLALLTIIVKQ